LRRIVKKTPTLRKHLDSYVPPSSVIFIRNSHFYLKIPTGASCIQATFLTRTRRCAFFTIRISRKKNLSMYNIRYYSLFISHAYATAQYQYISDSSRDNSHVSRYLRSTRCLITSHYPTHKCIYNHTGYLITYRETLVIYLLNHALQILYFRRMKPVHTLSVILTLLPK
jgi:hypothetical protein